MTIQYRLMQEDDAEKVVALYRTVYGEEYPIKSVYDPKAILAAQRAGEFYRVLAIDPDNDDKVVGQTAAYHSASPNRELYEEGQGIVLPEYRNQGILEQCFRFAHDVAYPKIGIVQKWGEAVCNHVFMQRAGYTLGNYVFTGIEIDLMPAAAYDKEKSSAGRVSSVVGFNVSDAGGLNVYLHDVYKESILWLFEGLPLKREFIEARDGFSPEQTRITEEIHAGAGVARFTFMGLGHDFETCMLRHEKAALSKGCTVLQAYLNLSEPAVGAALNILRQHHYFIGGLFPCWFGGDGILMQKILHEPNIAGIKLHGERNRQILDMAMKDRQSVL